MTDTRDITACAGRRHKGLGNPDPAGVRQVFHEKARITGCPPGGLHQMTVDEFAGFVAVQLPSPEVSGEGRMLEILSCDVAGQTASIRRRTPVRE